MPLLGARPQGVGHAGWGWAWTTLGEWGIDGGFTPPHTPIVGRQDACDMVLS